MPAFIDEAICIRHWDWSETSQTVAIFTREHGVVRALAKGSRRPKAPYSGGIELLTRAEIGLILRPNADLALLTSWDLRQSFPALRSVLAAHNAGLYMADLVNSFVRDHDAHRDLYDALLRALEGMTTVAAVPIQILRFQWDLLAHTGFRPELAIDVRSGEPLGEEPDLLFNAALGGFVRPGSESGSDAGAWRVRRSTLQALREVSGESSTATLERQVDPTILDRANRLLASYIRHVLGAEPPTMPVLFGGGLAQ